MKKILIGLGLLFCLAIKSHAYTLTYEKPFSSSTVVGMRCSTGTVIAINQTLAATSSTFVLAGHRVTNDDSTYDVFIGYDANVSSHSSTANGLAHRGLRATPRVGIPMPVGYNTDLATQGSVYCIAEDSAGSSGVIVSVETFGYK